MTKYPWAIRDSQKRQQEAGERTAPSATSITFSLNDHPAFPNVCVGCCSPDALEGLVYLVVARPQRKVGGLVGTLVGGPVGGMVGGALDGLASVPLCHLLQVCADCKRLLSPEDLRKLKQAIVPAANPPDVSNVLFTRKVCSGHVKLEFTHAPYLRALRDLQLPESSRRRESSGAEPGTVVGLLKKILPHMPNKSWYLAPDIPEEMLLNAVASFAKDIDPKDVLALADFSPLRTGKNGLVCTSSRVCYGLRKEVHSFPLDELETAHAQSMTLVCQMRSGAGNAERRMYIPISWLTRPLAGFLQGAIELKKAAREADALADELAQLLQ